MIIRHYAEELASLAKKIGAHVVRGPVRCPAHGGGLDIGDLDIEELLRELKDQEVLVIIAPLGLAQELRSICGLCGMPYEGGECPVCKAEREKAKRVVEERLLFDEEFLGLLT